MIAAITSLAEFQQVINEDKVTVIDFWATWCGPCKVMSPVFEKLAEAYPDVSFRKVDVDAQEAVTEECGVTTMPSFLIFKDGEKIGTVAGAYPDKLKEALASVTKA